MSVHPLSHSYFKVTRYLSVMKVLLCSLLILCLGCVVINAKPFRESRGGSPGKTHLSPAQPCDTTKCQPPSCRCASTDIPGGLTVDETPQIVMFSFDDGLRDQDYSTYYSKVFGGRKNPNDCPISLTYFVSHDYTDYALVEHVKSVDRAEIADHSVTHRTPTTWWLNATEEEMTHEVVDQQSILHLWGNVEQEKIRGFRAPFLATSEMELKVLHENGFIYEASMVTDTNYWPFTLDYKSPICNSPATCPESAYPGLWLVPNVVYQQSSGYPCPMLDACTAPVTEQDWMDFFEDNFNVHYKHNRSPFGVYSHSAWFFGGQARVDALNKFLEKLGSMKDVYIVSHSQLLDWVRNPTPLHKIPDFEAWKCPPLPEPTCQMESPVCNKFYEDAGLLKSCNPCPPNYPGYGDPEGK